LDLLKRLHQIANRPALPIAFPNVAFVALGRVPLSRFFGPDRVFLIGTIVSHSDAPKSAMVFAKFLTRLGSCDEPSSPDKGRQDPTAYLPR
jgi:hypothetical protein